LLDGGIKSNDVPPSPSKKAGFGDTMSGFKLEDDSSEEDLTNIPPYMIPYR